MAWEEILPMRGRQSRQRHNVTLAWRRNGSAKFPHLVIVASKDVVTELGWYPQLRLRQFRDLAAGKLRLAPDSAGFFSAAVSKAGVLGQKVRLNGVDAEPRKADGAEYVVEGDALVITLPDWAAPERVKAEAQIFTTQAGVAGAEKARQAAIERAGAPAPSKTAYVGISERVRDPNIGRRLG